MMPDPYDLPDFFESNPVDPVRSATGSRPPRSAKPKKKVGFYLTRDLINRFDRKFHELKLAGTDIGNKSTLLEAALAYALDDLDRGEHSQVLERI